MFVPGGRIIEKLIKKRLKEIEKNEDVEICIAVETGSRAWGFPSPDSDYDVRFLYIRRPEWYISIDLERKRDVIELMTDDILDIVGWDIRKALNLFYKSNPPLLEWLQSPFVYMEKHSLACRMREMLPEFFSGKAGYFHYLHMARKNYSEYLQGEKVRLKKYFYVLRPLMAVRWIEKGLGSVPIEFKKILDETIESSGLMSEINKMIEIKSGKSEAGEIGRIESVDEFIRGEFERHDKRGDSQKKHVPDMNLLNGLFIDTLKEVWGVTDLPIRPRQVKKLPRKHVK